MKTAKEWCVFEEVDEDLMRDVQTDARKEPLEVLQLFLEGCHAASDVHSGGQRCYWCGKERCDPECARARALQLVTEGDAPAQHAAGDHAAQHAAEAAQRAIEETER